VGGKEVIILIRFFSL